MLKHSVVLKFNNVEMLKGLWKMLKSRLPRAPVQKGKIAYGNIASLHRKKTLTKQKKSNIIKARRGTGELLKTSSECQIGGWQRNWTDQNNGDL